MSTAVMSMFSCGHFSRYPSRGIPPALQIASLFLVPLQQLLSANSAQRATSTFLPFFVARLARLGTACSTWTWGQRHKALLSSELWSGELWAVTVSELNFITTGILIHYIKAIEYKWGTFRKLWMLGLSLQCDGVLLSLIVLVNTSWAGMPVSQSLKKDSWGINVPPCG